MTLDARIAAYEGLTFKTAARYAPYLDDDLADVQQLLRMAVWKALVYFNPERSKQTERAFVFGCVRNKVKDILKGQYRLNRERDGSQAYLEDVQQLERWLSVTAEQVFGPVEDYDLRLPSTLSELEVKVVHLLLLDFSQTESAALLGVSRKRVRLSHRAIMEKMEDWRPSSAGRVPPVAA